MNREEQRAAIRAYQDQTQYAPTLPPDAVLDDYGRPVVDDHPDEDPDERL